MCSTQSKLSGDLERGPKEAVSAAYWLSKAQSLHWVSECEELGTRTKSWWWNTKPDKWWFLFKALTASPGACWQAPKQSRLVRYGCLGLAHAPSSPGLGSAGVDTTQQLKGVLLWTFLPWFRPLNQCRALCEHCMGCSPAWCSRQDLLWKFTLKPCCLRSALLFTPLLWDLPRNGWFLIAW